MQMSALPKHKMIYKLKRINISEAVNEPYDTSDLQIQKHSKKQKLTISGSFLNFTNHDQVEISNESRP